MAGGNGRGRSSKCFECQKPVNGIACNQCGKAVCKNCSKKLKGPNGSKKMTICNSCNGSEPDVQISLPSRAEKVFSLKPGDS